MLSNGLLSFFTNAFNVGAQAVQNGINLDYSKAMTEQNWSRDDTSYQRSVADAVSAGFSPLAVLDGGLISNSSPIGYQGQAPQLDTLALQNYLYSQSLNEQTHKFDLDYLNESFDNEIAKLEQAYIHNQSIENQRLINDLRVMHETFNLTLDEQANQYTLDKQLEEFSRVQRNLEAIGVSNFEDYTDKTLYFQAYAKWYEGLMDTLNQASSTSSASTSSGSKANVKGSASAGIESNNPLFLPNASGDVSVSGGYESQDDNGTTVTNNPFAILKQSLIAYNLFSPMPRYVGE